MNVLNCAFLCTVCFGEVSLYADDDFEGAMGQYGRGAYNTTSMQDKGIQNNAASSMVVPEGCQVTLYSDNNYNGAATVYTPGKYTQNANDGSRRLNHNDDTSSLIVEDYGDRGGMPGIMMKSDYLMMASCILLIRSPWQGLWLAILTTMGHASLRTVMF